MKHKVLALGAAAAVVLTVLVGSDRYLERHTTKIDETVSIVTLDEYLIVMQQGQKPQVTRVQPPVTKPREMRVEPPTPTGVKPKQPTTPTTIRWTLPYSCADVKYYSSHFTQAQLDSMRKAAGMALPTADQRAQIQACLAGRVK